MFLKVMGVESEMSLQTVVVAPNKTDPDNIYMFRCYHCGTSIARVRGRVESISAGLIPNLTVTVVNQCYVCKENYTFQDGLNLKQTIKLSLSPTPSKSLSTFHCINCRNQLIQYTDKVTKLLPEYLEMPLNGQFTCFLDSCRQKYVLDEIVGV